LVYFHGSGGTANDVYDYNSLRAKAVAADLSGDPSRPGFFLLAIEARNLHWPGHRPEDGTKHDYFFRDLGSPSRNPDIAVADQFIDQLVADGSVDRSRIYTTGWSNGAQYAELYAIARHETATPGGNHVAAAAVYSGSDPFNNTATDQQPSCQLAPYPQSTTPIFMISRACDAHPCDAAQEASLTALGLDPPPGATVGSWMSDLRSRLMDPNGQWEIISGTGQVVTACSHDPACTEQTAVANHIRWPDGKAFGDGGNDHEPEMLAFLRDHSATSPTGALDQQFDLPHWPDRPYSVHVPARPGPLPVVLAIHGGGGNAASMRKLTCPGGDEQSPGCLTAVADREGFVVVFPNGTGNPEAPEVRSYNAYDGPNLSCTSGYACAHHIDDIAFFTDLLDDVERRFAVDRSRIFLTGISNGAAMSHTLACTLPDRIAAIAPVAGEDQYEEGWGHSSCDPKGSPISVLEIHGDEDPAWPYDGGTGRANDGGYMIPVAWSVADWYRHDAPCTAPMGQPSTRWLPDADPADGTRARIDLYSCHAGTEVGLVTVLGGGHTWPGGYQYLPVERVGHTSLDFNANDLMWSFFRRHPKP
jgi:polyhydroxybutyrate depolymerase